MIKKDYKHEISIVLTPIIASIFLGNSNLENTIDSIAMVGTIGLIILLLLKYVFSFDLNYQKAWLTIFWSMFCPPFGLYLLIKNKKLSEIYRFFSIVSIIIVSTGFFINIDNDYESPVIKLKADTIECELGSGSEAEITKKLVKSVSDNRSILNINNVEIENFEDIDFTKPQISKEVLTIEDESFNKGNAEFTLIIK